MIKELIKRFVFPNSYNEEAYKNLRKKGVIIGENVTIWSPNHTTIDIQKPWLIKIGDNCKITTDVCILAHDYGVSVPRRKFGKMVGGSLPVTIGNNVFIGIKSTILMGTTIGDNCIIGANSVVKGDFPEGVVIAGNPAKIICTVEDYYKRNLDKWVENAKLCAKTIYRNSGHIPTIEEMSDGYAWLYLERNEDNIKEYRAFFTLSSDDYNDIVKNFYNCKPYYQNYSEFLKDCGFDLST